MLIDKQDLAHFIQAFVNYLPDVAADQRGHTPGSKECCGLCVGQGRTQVSLLGQGGDGSRFLQAGVSPALKTSPQSLTGCCRFQFPIVQTSESWWLKYLPGDKYS